jgi:translation initiation factor 2 gamma subunit (eIF-2gamma)
MLFKREIIRQDNVLVFRNSFDILRTVYAKEEYPGIREYFKRIYGVVNDNIVLKKKK